MNNYTLLRVKASFSFIFVMIILILGAFLFRDWLLSNNYFAHNPTLQSLLATYKEFFEYIKGDKPPHNIIIDYAIPFILFFITISFSSIIAVGGFVVIRRAFMHFYVNKRNAQIEGIQNLIIDYLYKPDSVIIETLKNEKKSLVVNEMVHLHNSFIGKKVENTKCIFEALELEKFVAKNINSILWHRKVRYLKVACAMDLVNLLPTAKKDINSSNWNVRNAAQLAALKLDKGYSFDFLAKVHRNISKWQQTQMHHLIIRESIPVEQFSQYLFTENKSVTIFCIRMMEAFNQKEHDEKLIKLLDDEDYDIRREALKAIIKLNVSDAESFITNTYDKQSVSIKILMMQALAKFNTPSAIAFITKKLPSDTFDINMSALKHLKPAARQTVLDKIEWNAQIEAIANHVNNKQIV